MSGDGGGHCTGGTTLATMVKRLLRWTSPGESAVSSQQHLHGSVLSSSLSADLIGSDLNGNVPRGDSTASGDVGTGSGVKLPFEELSYRRTGDVTVCRHCGRKMNSSELRAGAETGTQSSALCSQCCHMRLDHHRRDFGHLRSSANDIRRQSGRPAAAAVDYGEPVCCCDSCSAVAIRRRRSPDFASNYWMYSSTDLCLSSASLPTSVRQSPTLFDVAAATPVTRPRLSTMQSTNIESEHGRPLADSRRFDYTGRSGNGARIVVDLPVSIPVSPDGEEGYPAYQRGLAARNQAVRDGESLLGGAPPNVTIRHLTDDDDEELLV